MKKTIKIKINKSEYKEYVNLLLERGFTQIGTRLFEDNQSYVKFYITQ